MKDSLNRMIWLCRLLIVFGIAMKFYGLNDPWKRNDHYNFGGIRTTIYAECLKETPLAISKGIPHSHCWTSTPQYYNSHPSTVLFAMWGWTNIFGSSEAAYRSFVLLFSVLNIFLLFQIARLARPDSDVFPWLAAALQSIFLGGMYFGTHPDFIGEFTISFILFSSWLALKGFLTLAGLTTFLAGVSAWPGYIGFAPLWLYTLLVGRARKRIFAMAVCGFVFAALTMIWLKQQDTDTFAFFKMKLFYPGHVAKHEKVWYEPLLFAMNVVTSWARLLSPVLASIAAFELIRGDGRAFFTQWRNRWSQLNSFHHAVLLAGGTGVFYSLSGHEYFRVHVYLYLFMTPGLALLIARFIERWALHQPVLMSSQERKVMTIALLLFASFYPYGIYQSSLLHDVVNSILLIGSTLFLIWITWTTNRRLAPITGLLVVCAVSNASQTINYRNERDTERSFCEKARQEYEQTGLPIKTTEERSEAKDLLYCRGIPIEYIQPEN